MNELSFAMTSNVMPSSPSVAPVPPDNRVRTACSRGLLALLLMLALPAVVQAQFTFTTNGDNTITITKYTGSGGAVTIPDTINGLPVTSIGSDAFNSCFGLTSIAIPNSVATIDTNAFYDCLSLTSVTIPDSVTIIADNAFGSCFSLTSVTIGTNVISLGSYAFQYLSEPDQRHNRQ